MDALSVAGWWLTIRNLLDSLGRPCIGVVPETSGCKHGLVVTVELIYLPHNDPVCIALWLRRSPNLFLTGMYLNPLLPTPDTFAKLHLINLFHTQRLEQFILSFSPAVLADPIFAHRAMLLNGPACHLLAFTHHLHRSLFRPILCLIASIVDSSATIFQLTLTPCQMFLCLFELLKPLPLEELVCRAYPLQTTHLQVF